MNHANRTIITVLTKKMTPQATTNTVPRGTSKENEKMTPQAKILLQSLLAEVSWEMHNGMNLREHCDDRRDNYTDEQLEDAYDELKNILYDMTLED